MEVRRFSACGGGESACTPDSVTGPAAPAAAIHLGRRLPAGSSGLPGGQRAGHPPPARPCSGWGLPSRPGHPGRWCALTAPFHPYLCRRSRGPPAIGGLFSVALSCGSPRLGVTQHPALWSPDVPRPGHRRVAAVGPDAAAWPTHHRHHDRASTLRRIGFVDATSRPARYSGVCWQRSRPSSVTTSPARVRALPLRAGRVA